MTLIIGILTVSDRASQGVYEDRSTPAVRAYFEATIRSDWQAVTDLVPDEFDMIEAALHTLVMEQGCHLVITTGGTGPAPRDITPEVTEKVCEKLLPGFGEQMRRVSLQHVPTAILSRQTAGIYRGALIINLPGNPKAVQECLDAVIAAVPACLTLIGAPHIDIK